MKKIFLIILAVFLTLSLSSDLFARGGSFGGSRGGFGGSRGGSFGGSRSTGGGSFGGFRSKSYSSPSASKPSSSFGGTRSSNSGGSAGGFASRPSSVNWGGRRLGSAQEYTKSYGIPRRVVRSNEMQGLPQNYIVNQYGGASDRFMMGYIMGSTNWMWYTPFHPAFYYSRPHYVEREDGMVEVYPPVFSWGKLFFTILIIGGVLFIIVVAIKSRKNRGVKSNNFGSFDL